MTVELNSETEKLVEEELRSGFFNSIDEIIVLGIRARHEKEQPQRAGTERRQAVGTALDFATHRAVPLEDVSIRAGSERRIENRQGRGIRRSG
jgi:Arc/MetJ-type ribon-helix-helix transcriptional regulator